MQQMIKIFMIELKTLNYLHNLIKKLDEKDSVLLGHFAYDTLHQSQIFPYFTLA